MKPRKVMGVALLVATLGGLAYFARSYKPSIIKTDTQRLLDKVNSRETQEILRKLNNKEYSKADFASSVVGQLIGGKK